MGMLPFGSRLPPVGLDIGTNTFRVAQLQSAPEKPVLGAYGSLGVPVGAVIEGEIVDVEAVSQTLTQLWKNTGFTNKRVVIGVANQKVVVRLVELPFMDKSELRGALQYQAQDYIPIPIEEAILDFQIVGDFLTENEERMIQVLLVAAQKDMVGSHVAAAEGAGLRPVAIDVSSFAIVRSLLPAPGAFLGESPEQPTAIALINIAAGTTNIVVVEKHSPRFTRVSSIGGNSFSEAVSEHLGISIDEAEDLKRRAGLPLPGSEVEGGAEDAENLMHVQQILDQEFGKFIAEARRSLDYYLAQTTQVGSIDKVILSGSGSLLRNLPERLRLELQIAVEVGNPLIRVEPGRGIKMEDLERDTLSMAICVGLALREFEK